jgi:hypothetical protein
MRALNILIVLSIVFFTSKPILAQEDYVATSTTALEINEKQCSRFAKHSVKRIDKLTARIKKTNDAYLAKFKNAENALMQKLCFINEQSAEAMMQDAWYSFNRFENMCAREGNQAPKGYFAELDTLTQATEFLSTHTSAPDEGQHTNTAGQSHTISSDEYLQSEPDYSNSVEDSLNSRF